MRLRLLCTFVLLSGAIAAAQGAWSLFDEVARHLTLSFGGAARGEVAALVAAARSDLAGGCPPDPACATEVGIAAVEGVLQALADPHTRLLSPAEYGFVAQRIAGGNAPAFGVVLHAPTNGLGWVVLRTVVGSNAEAAGLVRGDRILSVDGLTPSADASARHLTWAEAAEDGVIRALVLRAGSPPFTVDVMAGVSALDPLPRLTLFGDHGWLEVPSLVPHEVVTPVVHALVRAAEGAGVTRLIVDLRDDAGGSRLAAVAVAGAFMPVALEVITGPTLDLTLRFEAGTEAVLDAFGRTLERSAPIAAGSFAGELIVLINRRTASCAESLALALQADAGALLIGEATAGMADGVVTFLPLSGGMGLALTIGQVRDARFMPIAKRAVPDVWVVDDPMALAAGIDAPLELARSIAWPE